MKRLLPPSAISFSLIPSNFSSGLCSEAHPASQIDKNETTTAKLFILFSSFGFIST
jgi:hypothetical protein